MAQYIDKSTLVAELNDWRNKIKKGVFDIPLEGRERADAAFEYEILGRVIDFLDAFEVKDVDLMLHTIIAEGCDWLAMNTNLSHDEIEGCRNLMLTVKEEQLKAQKGE